MPCPTPDTVLYGRRVHDGADVFFLLPRLGQAEAKKYMKESYDVIYNLA
jgi:hypothetical protein